MYAEAGLQYPFLRGSPPELAPPPPPHYHHQHYSHLPPLDTGLTNGGPYMGNMMDASIISEYDLGGEGDLFKAPEPIIEEPVLPLHPMIAAMSIISGGDDVITETFKVGNMELAQTDHLLNDVFYECKNDLLEKSSIKESFSEVLDAKIPAVQTEEDSSAETIRLIAEGQLPRSVSTGNLTSMEWIGGSTTRPNFLDFQVLDFEAVFGMRRAYSEGDIQNLDDNNTKFGSTRAVRSPFELLLTISDLKSEERKQKLSRYRKKKTERNFGRKIKVNNYHLFNFPPFLEF
ncbi:zinc finger protein CONSTANS-LIKE 1 [Cocos nucifera]|uniref:Zinc finger protein CONSTANS-LIKE 1 n=1 Tax=Cocos nucifera TaxID=13894 RepID=A0A8K0NC62_COCNU|nr:zinc finger protein CONSTANS-LIKE 1 [Cocos nucifera]